MVSGQERNEEPRGGRTLLKPMAADFSRKHWRQRSRPYLRMRPAWWAHRRLKRLVRTLLGDFRASVSIIAPLARALSVFSRTREPNGVVCHGEMISRDVYRGGIRLGQVACKCGKSLCQTVQFPFTARWPVSSRGSWIAVGSVGRTSRTLGLIPLRVR